MFDIIMGTLQSRDGKIVEFHGKPTKIIALIVAAGPLNEIKLYARIFVNFSFYYLMKLLRPMGS